jgi:hypothetical protein
MLTLHSNMLVRVGEVRLTCTDCVPGAGKVCWTQAQNNHL